MRRAEQEEPPQARLQAHPDPGTLSFTGHAGRNKVSFQGRISHSKKLGLGSYTLVITATNAAAQHSSTKQLSFTIVK